ncbi:MAG: hypothetical protein U9Q79_08490 [Candidatus Hydrogenedentes bacterium]|nr:hypothetical protein [Candidatus Hydrogenedentota bacterium]
MLAVALWLSFVLAGAEAAPVDIGSRLELFLDEYLIESMTGTAEFRLHTSAAGTISIQIQDANGTPIEGYALADCPPVFGESIARIVRWKNGTDIGGLGGRPVRLRVVLQDAELYSLQFVQGTANQEGG